MADYISGSFRALLAACPHVSPKRDSLIPSLIAALMTLYITYSDIAAPVIPMMMLSNSMLPIADISSPPACILAARDGGEPACGGAPSSAAALQLARPPMVITGITDCCATRTAVL